MRSLLQSGSEIDDGERGQPGFRPAPPAPAANVRAPCGFMTQRRLPHPDKALLRLAHPWSHLLLQLSPEKDAPGWVCG